MPTGSEFSEGVAGRYASEKAKFKAQQALRLKTNMAKLLGNFDHSDILLEAFDGRQLPAHICVLKNRAPGFYETYIEPVFSDKSIDSSNLDSSNSDSSTKARSSNEIRSTPIAKIRDVDYNWLKFFLRCIYTAEEVPSHPSMCTDAVFTTSSTMSSSGCDPTPRDRNDDDPSTDHVMENSSFEESGQNHVFNASQANMTTSNDSSKLVTSLESHGSGRTYVLDEHEPTQRTYPIVSSEESTPARNRYKSPDRGTRALTITAYSMSDSVVEPMTGARTSGSPVSSTPTADMDSEFGRQQMMTSFAELAAAANATCMNKGENGDMMGSGTPESLALTTSMESATSDDRGYDSPYGSLKGRRHRADHMIAKFIRMDGASSSSEQSPQQQQPLAEKKIFPMFIEVSDNRPSRLSLCDSENIPLSVVAAAAVRRCGSGSMESPGKSQMGRKRWSVTSLRSIDSADLASPLSSHGSVIIGLDEENWDVGSEDAALQGACSRLGKDLLNMFMEGKDTDLIIVTNSGQLKAHRCILASSCPYFKAMLNGDWLENRNSTIELNGFSDSTVSCALRLIYGGIVDVAENVSVWELISFADMIQLDDLKQLAYLHIRGKYCHFFHKPCSGCVKGVLECLPYLRSFRIEELLERCRQWQAKYFSRIWKTKLFNLLPEDILDLCYRSVIDSMNPNNILDLMLGCEKLQLTLPKSKSSEAAGALVACLTDAALEYLSLHLDNVLESPSFSALGKGYALNLSLFEDVLPSVVHSLSPDVGCRSLVKLYELMTMIVSQQRTGDEDWNERFVNMLRRLYELCDTHLIHYASAVIHCDGWKLLTPEMQKRIRETGIFIDIRQPKAPPPRLSSFNRSYKRSSSSADRVRDRSVSIQRFRPPPPLTECPSKPNVAETTPTKSTDTPSTPAAVESKFGTIERKKHRRQTNETLPAPISTVVKSEPMESHAITDQRPTENNLEVTTILKRSSTTDLTPGGSTNANIPEIGDQQDVNVENGTSKTAEVENIPPNVEICRVEKPMDDSEVAPKARGKESKDQSAVVDSPKFTSTLPVSKQPRPVRRKSPTKVHDGTSHQGTDQLAPLDPPKQIQQAESAKPVQAENEKSAVENATEKSTTDSTGHTGKPIVSKEDRKPTETNKPTGRQTGRRNQDESSKAVDKIEKNQAKSVEQKPVAGTKSVGQKEVSQDTDIPKSMEVIEADEPPIIQAAPTSSDKLRTSTKTTGPTTITSVLPKKPVSPSTSTATAKPTAKVAGIPKLPSSSGVQPAQCQGSASTSQGTSSSSRTTRPNTASNNKPKASVTMRSPVRKAKTVAQAKK